MKIRIKIGYVLIGITYVATITAILAGCGAPFRKNWQIDPDPGSTSPPDYAIISEIGYETDCIKTTANLPSRRWICSLP